MYQYKKDILKIFKTKVNNPTEYLQLARTIQKILSSKGCCEIIFLPFLLYESKPINKETLTNLCVANISGWVAYTIFDDILDGQSDVSLLPLAQKLIRMMYYTYFSILQNENDKLIIKKILDYGDSAYYLEKKFCHFAVISNQIDLKRFSPYKKIETVRQKSIGCSTSAIIASMIADDDSIGILKFFKYFLSAKQLSDDACDWFKDLKNGLETMASSAVLSEWKKSEHHFLDLETDHQEINRIFWKKVVPKISRQILFEINKSREIIRMTKLVENTEIFERLLRPIEHGAKQAMKKSLSNF